MEPIAASLDGRAATQIGNGFAVLGLANLVAVSDFVPGPQHTSCEVGG